MWCGHKRRTARWELQRRASEGGGCCFFWGRKIQWYYWERERGVWQGSEEKAEGEEGSVLMCQCLTNLSFLLLSYQSYPKDNAAQTKDKEGTGQQSSINSCLCWVLLFTFLPSASLKKKTRTLHFLFQVTGSGWGPELWVSGGTDTNKSHLAVTHTSKYRSLLGRFEVFLSTLLQKTWCD